MKRPVRGVKDNRILNDLQRRFLQEFVLSDISYYFRLSGGTALSAFYLEHRRSEDIDFFSSEKIPVYIIERFLKSLPFVKEINRTKLYDRNIFLLDSKDDRLLKVEFTYYPLRLIEEVKIVDGLRIEGFMDIVINKLCAISDRVEPKDYVDVYFAIKNEGLSLERLFILAEKKCDIAGIRHILKSRLIQVPEDIEKLPLLIDVNKKEVEDFFSDEIRKIVESEIDT
ncbi:MAG: nucleotidyl transferase AbiEii/AbiGii toxin family protein [Nitrospirae bacterium]|nr:nucleotidyl transferase AbiEii/AbiGii toxin family protein [Nitrospirota bacterium]